MNLNANSTVFERKQKFFDLWAPHYDFLFTTIFYQALHKRSLEFVDFPPQAYVLDLGCGTGRFLNRLGAEYPTVRATGLDLSAEMLKQAREKNQWLDRISYREGNAESLPFSENSFDAVFCTISFLHYPNPQKVLSEIYRVLKPGSSFYWVDGTTKDEIKSGIFSPFFSKPDKPLQIYTPREREELAREQGFVQTTHHYLLFSILLSILTKASKE